MRRMRRFAIVLLALGVVTAAIYATGAFTSLTAQRNANVAVAGDASAYLSLKPSSGPNSVYASYDGNGQLQVVLGDGATGSGVNRDAVTIFKNVFTITNQGSQTIDLWLTDGSDAVTFQVNGQSIEGKRQAITITPGTTKSVGLVVDTNQVGNGQDLLKTVTFHSSSEVSGSTSGSGSGGSADQPAMDSPPTPQMTKPPASPSKEGDDGSNSKYEDCSPLDVDCHIRATLRPLKLITSGDDTNRGESSSEKSTVDTLINFVGHLVPVVGPMVTYAYNAKKDSNTLYETGMEYIRKFNADIGNIIDFLKKHPELAAMITSMIPGMGIADWVYENPEKAKAFALGGVLGEMGMPSGLLEVSESSSPFYLLGALGIATTPYVGVLADARDFSQNIYSAVTELDLGDAAEAFLDLLGLIGSTGVGYGAADLPKIVVYTAKWIDKFPSEANTAIKIISKFIPSSASKRITVGILNILSDGAASTLVKKGVPVSDIIRYASDGNLKKVAEASDTVLPAAVKRGEMTSKQWANLVNKGHDPRVIKRLLDSRRYKAEDIQMLVQHGVDFETAEFLAKKGFGPDDIRTFVKKGNDPKMVEDIIKKDVPVEDVRYYTEHGNSLKVVKWALEQGYKPKDIKKLYRVVNKGKLGGNIVVTTGNFYVVANNYCNWQRQPGVDEKWKAEGFCQTIQVSPMMETGTTKATN